MNKDIRIDVDFLDHPKTIKLIDRLGKDSVFSLLKLWTWTAKFRPEGILYDLTDSYIAQVAARWDGDAQEFISTLLEYHFIDEKKGAKILHNWKIRNAWAASAKKRSTVAQKTAASRWGDGLDRDKRNKMKRSQRLSEARKKASHTKEEWLEMVSFFNDTCVKCNGESELNGVVKDHIIPLYQGGDDGVTNLQPLCALCNAKKGPEDIDYRVIYCKNNSLHMPDKWKKTSALGRHSADIKLLGTPSPSPNPSPTPIVKEEKIYIPVIEFLNLKAGTSYRWQTKATQEHINARTREGFTLDDFRRVIDNMAAEWKGDLKMERFLRPETLFGTKFENYLNANKSSAAPVLTAAEKERARLLHEKTLKLKGAV